MYELVNGGRDHGAARVRELRGLKYTQGIRPYALCVKALPGTK